MKMYKKMAALLLAISTLMTVFAVSASGEGKTVASVPVLLTVTNDYRQISVSLPAAFPVEVKNGTVVTADNVKISNNSETNIKVTDVKITEGTMKIGNYENFSGSETIALKLNGIPTKGEGKLEITEKAFPKISPKGSVNIDYSVKLSTEEKSIQNAKAANVVFTIATAD